MKCWETGIQSMEQVLFKEFFFFNEKFHVDQLAIIILLAFILTF